MINTVAPTIPEKRIVFYNLNWQKYQTIIEALGESRLARIIYDRGVLEITMPLEEHEFAREIIGLFIRILVLEMGLKIKTLGSTTLNYPELDRGAEPDNCYYIQNQSKVAGKKIDLTKDPPPDLVVEVDITHTDIDKINLYASMKISEFWRYNGEVLQIYQLQNQEYVEVENSPTFPQIEKARFYEFITESKVDEIEAEKRLRTDLKRLKGL
ncbi:MAG: Uma2 family endonuclease [Microcoleaceae cyanobacterium MO_207.B10]|nr:Uma2 family endonuclease [Microcoleaceae cyanobacterium MO_207.B10]